MDITDIKDKLSEIVEKIKSDPKLLEKFKANPGETLCEVTGISLSGEQLETMVKTVKTAVDATGLADKLGDLKKLF